MIVLVSGGMDSVAALYHAALHHAADQHEVVQQLTGAMFQTAGTILETVWPVLLLVKAFRSSDASCARPR